MPIRRPRRHGLGALVALAPSARGVAGAGAGGGVGGPPGAVPPPRPGS